MQQYIEAFINSESKLRKFNYYYTFLCSFIFLLVFPKKMKIQEGIIFIFFFLSLQIWQNRKVNFSLFIFFYVFHSKKKQKAKSEKLKVLFSKLDTEYPENK